MRSAASGTNGGQGKKLQRKQKRKQKRKRLDKAILACYAHLYENRIFTANAMKKRVG